MTVMQYCLFSLSSTLGNGSSLFNACSRALFGDESLSRHLRGLTSIELFLNANFYESHPLIKSQHVREAFNNTENPLHDCVSEFALKSLQKESHDSVAAAEASNIAKDFSFSPFLSMLALSSAIEKPIEAYYPVRTIDGDSETEVENRNGKEISFNNTIIPRNCSSETAAGIHIFRCASAPIDFLQTREIPETKNHYVPLLLLPEGSLETRNKKDEHAAKKLQTFTAHRSASNSIKLTTQNLSSENLAVKRKQLSIKSFAVKKAKSDDSVLPTISSATSSLPSFTILSSENRSERPNDESNSDLPTSSSSSPFAQQDIGNFYQQASSLSDQMKYDLLCNVWKPGRDFKFPANSSRRRFQYSWLQLYPWLAYSHKLDGAFCISCVLFGGEYTHNASKLNFLFKEPFKNWSKAIQKFNGHIVNSPIHKTATLRASHFRRSMENEAASVDVQLNHLLSEQVSKNRQKLKPIIEAILLCARQCIALRGHRDDAKLYEVDSNNPGNLQEILSYLARNGNNVHFQDHLLNAPRNATYRSKTTQNELLGLCGDSVLKSLTEEIRDAKYFSVLADEAADVSKIEQMSVVVRFVDKESNIREEFVGFTQCSEGLSGEAIAKTIKQALEDFGLDIKNCRGQGYDGAGNMAGKCSGAAVNIQREYPKALYVHCRSHVLNLCVGSASKIQMVKNMMGHVRVVSQFFNVHPKRFALLCEKIKSLLPESKHSNLIDVCRTRWVARIDGLDIFIELFEPIVASLADVKDNAQGHWNSDSCRDASGLFYGTVAFKFIVTLIVVYRCLAWTRPLTKQLQATDYDIVKCVEKVKFLLSKLSGLRSEISQSHNAWFEEATSMAQSVGTDPSMPRIVATQRNRANAPAQTPSQYYQRSLSIPFLDHLCSQISLRFSDLNLAVLSAFHALPARVVCQRDWQEKFRDFLSHCGNDLPEARHLEMELEMWQETWENYEGTPPTSVQSLLPLIDQLTFPNIHTAFQILATLPVTTCSCERSISALRRLKSYLRSTMKQDRLNALALLHVHRGIPVSSESIIDEFARRHPRRMKLIDILNTDPQ